jgi:hypothetical protein
MLFSAPRKIGAGAEISGDSLSNSVEAGNEDAAVAKIRLPKLRFGPELVPFVREPCVDISSVLWYALIPDTDIPPARE